MTLPAFRPLLRRHLEPSFSAACFQTSFSGTSSPTLRSASPIFGLRAAHQHPTVTSGISATVEELVSPGSNAMAFDPQLPS
jgi:hypothetical protein